MGRDVQPWSTAEDRYGRNLRRLREEAGLSQTDVAKRLRAYGVTLHPSAIAKIEARDVDSPRAIRLNEADAIARALGRKLEDLLSGPYQTFSDAAELLEQAAHNAESAQRWTDAGLEKLRGLIPLDEGVDPSTMPEIAPLRNRIIHALARINQAGLRGEHGEHPEA